MASQHILWKEKTNKSPTCAEVDVDFILQMKGTVILVPFFNVQVSSIDFCRQPVLSPNMGNVIVETCREVH